MFFLNYCVSLVLITLYSTAVNKKVDKDMLA